MQKLVKLLEQGKAELIDFEDLSGAYSRKKVDAVDKLLNELRQAALLSYKREKFGFRIKVNDMNQLKNFQGVSATKEALEHIDTDD